MFCVNGEHFLSSCSVKTKSGVERRTRKSSSIIIMLSKIGCATKKLFVSRVVPKYSAGLTLKIPWKPWFPMWVILALDSSRKWLVQHHYHRLRWYETLKNKTPAETFPKYPSVLRVIDRFDRNPPVTATSVTFSASCYRAVIDGFRSDLSITRKTDGNFRNVSAGVLFSKVAYQRKRW